MSIEGLDDAVNEALREPGPVAGILVRGVAEGGEGFVSLLRLPGAEAMRLTLQEAEDLALALMDAADAAAVLAMGAGLDG